MSYSSAYCIHHGSYEFYGRHVPPCRQCGYPELQTREEYYRAIGVPVVQEPSKEK